MHGSDVEGARDAVALRDRDVFALGEAMLVALEDDFVGIAPAIENERPAAAAVTQLAALLRGRPETTERRLRAVLQPAVAVQLAATGQGQRKLIAMVVATFEKFV